MIGNQSMSTDLDQAFRSPGEGLDELDEIAVPRQVQPPPTRLQQSALLVLAALGSVLLAASFVIEGGGERIERLLGAFLVTHAFVVAASWLPAGVLSDRVDRFLDSWVGSVSSGFYGLVALASFALAEATDLADDIAAFDIAAFGISEWLIPWLTGFSIDSVMNMIWATVWPLKLISEYGLRPGMLFVALSWGAFWAGTRLFPVQPLAARPREGIEQDD